jgi:hypothetical protein
MADAEGPINSTRRGRTMDQFDGTVNAGRKGMAYDWQSLLAAAEASQLDTELATLTPHQFAK